MPCAPRSEQNRRVETSQRLDVEAQFENEPFPSSIISDNRESEEADVSSAPKSWTEIETDYFLSQSWTVAHYKCFIVNTNVVCLNRTLLFVPLMMMVRWLQVWLLGPQPFLSGNFHVLCVLGIIRIRLVLVLTSWNHNCIRIKLSMPCQTPNSDRVLALVNVYNINCEFKQRS